MPRIEQLPPQVVAQIAAGEVIERPASVLKELVENSIDAGSSRIDIDVNQGGLDCIRVVDNGCGIEADDLPLAFAAHATSKLKKADDLTHIGTLGFRGEGLASVGSVARVVLQSRLPDLDRGAEIHCDGGSLSQVRVWNGSPGTRIEVRNLFYNTPVRRKFLRGPATEMGHVSEVFTRLALSQLGLHLTLRHNNRLVQDLPTTAGLLDRIAAFFGDDLRRRLLTVEGESNGMSVGGYIADPGCDRGGTQMQYIYVNGRWVRDRFISQSLQEAYKGLLLTGKHPVAFLFLDIPPEFVDVNVHPTKSEVRFRQPAKVQELIFDAARRALQGTDLTVKYQPPLPAPVSIIIAPAPEQGLLSFHLENDKRDRQSPKIVPPEQPVSLFDERMPSARSSLLASDRSPQDRREVPLPSESRSPEREVPSPSTPLRVAAVSVAERQIPVHPLAQESATVKAVQMHDLYLVVEDPAGILVIDQHALHERVLFEQLRARFAEGRLEVQRLLIPEPVSLPPAQAALLLDHKNNLAELGLEVDDFGGGTILLGGYPNVLGRKPAATILRAVAETLSSRDRVPTRDALLNDLMALLACHSAVRAGDRLTSEQMRLLVAQRHLAQDAHHCPHGRPSSLLFTRQDLDRQFRRT